jgi:hypothetical protein
MAVGDQVDEVMVRVGRAMGIAQRGDRTGARALFLALWEEVGADGDPFHRCAIAHSMADVQDELADELMWDVRALEAADLLTDERVAAGGVSGPVTGFYPSLHLNLADVYLRLGDTDRAGEHVVACRAALGALEDGGYRRMIVDALERVDGQLRST